MTSRELSEAPDSSLGGLFFCPQTAERLQHSRFTQTRTDVRRCLRVRQQNADYRKRLYSLFALNLEKKNAKWCESIRQRMRTLLPLLAATSLGLMLPHVEAHTTEDAKELLVAQRTIQTNDNKYSKPVDKSTIKDGSGKNTWIPIAFRENNVANAWIRVSTYAPLNENSFRFQGKYMNDNGAQIEGRVDVNCKNKDYYFRPNGVLAQNAPWSVIPQGSGIEAVAKLYCKRTAAKAEWGYTPETAFLWDAPLPTKPADMASGEWINHYNKQDGESYYNDGVEKVGNVVTFAFYYRTLKGDMTSKNKDVAKYLWMRASCERNIASNYVQLDQSVPGVWLPPDPGAPGGAVMIVRKKFCK